MEDIKRIVTPIDFSDNTETVVSTADDLNEVNQYKSLRG